MTHARCAPERARAVTALTVTMMVKAKKLSGDPELKFRERVAYRT
jgi:hypothetical protein